MAPDDTIDRIRSFWDADAAGYDQISGHYPQTQAEWAAWRGALEPLLPPAPSRVLDAGAGTGFLSLAVAGLGHVVTAVDLSGQMLARLAANALAQQLAVTAVQARADEVPREHFDVVMSRHLLWTVPDPEGTLRAWRAAAPGGRLVLVESVWGKGQSAAGRLRGCGGSPAWNGSWAASCPGRSGCSGPSRCTRCGRADTRTCRGFPVLPSIPRNPAGSGHTATPDQRARCMRIPRYTGDTRPHRNGQCRAPVTATHRAKGP